MKKILLILLLLIPFNSYALTGAIQAVVSAGGGNSPEWTDWKYPQTADTDGGAYQEWSNPTYVEADDDNYATVAVSYVYPTYSNYLRATNFGFTTSDVPEGSTINGIQVQVNVKASASSAAKDWVLYLANSGNNIGNIKNPGTLMSTDLTATDYGTATDKWGATISASDVVGSTFGVWYNIRSTSGTPTVSLDYIKMRINFTAP